MASNQDQIHDESSNSNLFNDPFLNSQPPDSPNNFSQDEQQVLDEAALWDEYRRYCEENNILPDPEVSIENLK